ncbi:MAG: T9SS type A sorting domain-containing protein [Bacteroidetes bacterium]|nr:MAG: T9SS type A sorting domain-containing protein [Bacteroidota bacterium]
MKKLLLTTVAILGVITTQAQKDTAMNFTKTDCDGISHTLFSELDSGNVVILEYAMLPSCQSCITANHAMEPMVDAYKISHPGKVRSYAIGFNNTYTCPTMQSWKTSNNIKSVAFTNGASEVAYYGGFGMPTIIVVGGSQHKVYYTGIGFAMGDTSQIHNAVKKAMGITTGIDKVNNDIISFNVFPNPAVAGKLNISFTLNKKDNITFKIYDLTGRNVYESNSQALAAGENLFTINTLNLKAGNYLLKIEGETFSSSQKISIAE